MKIIDQFNLNIIFYIFLLPFPIIFFFFFSHFFSTCPRTKHSLNNWIEIESQTWNNYSHLLYTKISANLVLLQSRLSNMGDNSNSTLFSSVLFLSPANAATIDDLLSHLNFLLLTFITSIFFILTKFKFKTSTNSKAMLLPPGPAPWPLVRNLPHLLNNKPTFRWIHGFMKEMNTEIACIQLGNVHVIPVTSPEISKEFLKKHDAVFASRPITMASEYSSGGFLTTAVVPWGDQWKKMRRVLASNVINPSTFRWLHDKRVEETDNLVRYVYNQCKISTSNNCLGSNNGGMAKRRRLRTCLTFSFQLRIQMGSHCCLWLRSKPNAQS
ncbi:unnamed protein product, partial [Vitis vinifera]